MKIICKAENDKLKMPKAKTKRILSICERYLATHHDHLWSQRNRLIINKVNKRNQFISLGKTLFNVFKQDFFIYHRYSLKYSPAIASPHNVELYSKRMFIGVTKGFSDDSVPDDIRSRVINIDQIRNISDKETQRIRNWFNLAYIISVNGSLLEHVTAYDFIWKYADVHNCLDTTVRTHKATRDEASAMATEMMKAQLSGDNDLIKSLFFNIVNIRKITGVKHKILKAIKTDFTRIFMTLYQPSSISMTSLLITLEADRDNYLGKPSHDALAHYNVSNQANHKPLLSFKAIAKYVHSIFIGIIFRDFAKVRDIYDTISAPSFMSKISAIDNQKGINLRSIISNFTIWLAKSMQSGTYNLKDLIDYVKGLSKTLGVNIIKGFLTIVNRQTIITGVYKIIDSLYFHPNISKVVNVSYAMRLITDIKGVSSKNTTKIKQQFYQLSHSKLSRRLIYEFIVYITYYLGYSGAIFSDIVNRLHITSDEIRSWSSN